MRHTREPAVEHFLLHVRHAAHCSTSLSVCCSVGPADATGCTAKKRRISSAGPPLQKPPNASTIRPVPPKAPVPRCSWPQCVWIRRRRGRVRPGSATPPRAASRGPATCIEMANGTWSCRSGRRECRRSSEALPRPTARAMRRLARRCRRYGRNSGAPSHASS